MNPLLPQMHAIAPAATPALVLAFGHAQAESLWAERRAPETRWRARAALPGSRTDWTPLPMKKRSDWR